MTSAGSSLGEWLVDAADFFTDYRTWGLTKTLYARLMRALSRWLFFCVVELRPLRSDPNVPTLAPGRRVRVATQEELDTITDDPVYEITKTFIRDSLKRGAYCMAAFDGDTIVSYTWRAFSTAPHVEGLWVEFDRRYRYGYKGFTHPDYRQQGLQNAISLLSDAECIRRGRTHGIGFIETHNYPSLISNHKRGNKRVGYAGFLRIRGRLFPFRTPGAKRHGFRFYLPSAHS